MAYKFRVCMHLKFAVSIRQNTAVSTDRLFFFVYIYMFFIWRNSPPPSVGQGLFIHEVSRSHTTTHQSRKDSSKRVISLSYKSLPAQHTTLRTDRHPCPPGGIRTHNLIRRAAADPRLRPRGHWDRQIYVLPCRNTK